MKTITVNFTDSQYDKLERLSRRRNCTIGKCIKLFAESCVPDGGSWKHPSEPVSEKKEESGS